MVERENPIKKEMGVQKPLKMPYAVNKAGDFSETSVREPWWPQNATGKKPIEKTLEDLNVGKSVGAIRVQNAITNMVKLGAFPRSIHQTISVNDYADSARGTVLLDPVSLDEQVAKNMEKLDGILGTARNHSNPMPWKPSMEYTKLSDEYSKKIRKMPVNLPMPLPVVGKVTSEILHDGSPAHGKQISVHIPPTEELHTLD